MEVRLPVLALGLVLIGAGAARPAAAGRPGRDDSQTKAIFKRKLSADRWVKRARWLPTRAGAGAHSRVRIYARGGVIVVARYARQWRDGRPGFRVHEYVRLRKPEPALDVAKERAAFEEAVKLLQERFVLRKLSAAELHKAAVRSLLKNAPTDARQAYRLATEAVAKSVGDKHTVYYPPGKVPGERKQRGLGIR
jgi:hypothetical protein